MIKSVLSKARSSLSTAAKSSVQKKDSTAAKTQTTRAEASAPKKPTRKVLDAIGSAGSTVGAITQTQTNAIVKAKKGLQNIARQQKPAEGFGGTGAQGSVGPLGASASASQKDGKVGNADVQGPNGNFTVNSDGVKGDVTGVRRRGF